MITLIIALIVCLAILFIIFFLVWRRTNWKKIDETNQNLYNEDGDHIYYDRRIIEQKKKSQQKEDQR